MNLLLSSLFCLALGVAAQTRPALQLIFDATQSSNATEPSAAETSLVKREARASARRAWGEQVSNCSSEFEIVDVARGAFTAPHADQRAVLYKFCETGHNFALDGLVVLEAGRVVAHVAYEGGWDDGLKALPDINGNGLSELLILTGGMNMGELWGVVSIIELGARGPVRKFGQAQTYTDNCGALAEEGTATAIRLLVKRGASPIFYRESFTKKNCGDQTKWTRRGTSKPFRLERDRVNYRRLS